MNFLIAGRHPRLNEARTTVCSLEHAAWRSTTDGGAVAARIAGSFETLERTMHDCTGVAHCLIEIGSSFDQMSRRGQFRKQFGGKPALQAQ